MKDEASCNAGSVFVPVTHLTRRAHIMQVSVGICALLLGVMVYLIDRSPSSVYFIPPWLSMSDNFNQVFGILGNYLPTFVHPLAFILFTSVFVEPNKRNILLICMTWLAIDGLFECAQIKIVAHWLITFIPAFTGIPVLENTRNYFIHGTFDVLDVLSIVLGTVAAYFIVRNTNGSKLCE